MYCPHCGKQINDDGAYCRFCGKKIEPVRASQPVQTPSSPENATTQAMPAVGAGQIEGAQTAPDAEATQAMQPVQAVGAQATQVMQPVQTEAEQTAAQPAGDAQDPLDPAGQAAGAKGNDKVTVIMLAMAGILFVALIAAGIFFATGGELPFGDNKEEAPKAQFANGQPPAQNSGRQAEEPRDAASTAGAPTDDAADDAAYEEGTSTTSGY